MKLKNLKISKQLNIGLGFIFLLVLLLGAISLFNSDRLWQNTKGLYEHILISQQAIGSIQTDVLNIRLEMNGLILEKNEQKMQERLMAIDTYEADAYQQMDILYASYLGPKSDIDNAYNSVMQYKPIRDETIRLLQAGNIDEAAQRVRFDGVGGILVDKVMRDLAIINDFAKDNANQLYKDAQQQKSQNILQLSIILGTILILVGGIGIFLRKGILRPLKELTAATEAFHQGKLGTRSRYESANEFGSLSSSFNAMTETIQSEIQNKDKRAAELIIAKEQAEAANAVISKTEKYNRSLIEASLDPLVTIGPNGIITDVNIATENATGLPREKLIGTDFSEYFTEPGKAEAGYQQVFKDGEVFDYELELKNISGFITPVLYNASVYKDDEGKVIGVFAAARDITTILKFENELIYLKNNLESVNRELEAFSYSVSHDLKAPLRHITGYISLLVRKYIDLLPEEARRYLDNISFSAKNMGELIDGLLQFSKTGRIDMNQRLLNMNELVDTLIQPIKEQDTGRRIECNIDPMPLAFGDPDMIKSVWSNLVENAIKFTKNKDLVKITIGAEENENDIIYYIKDNGAGFDMNYATKLFKVFQRLHSREDYDGTGIGLATVQRIITRHGGKTWAEGKIGEGATFYFSLIKRKESE